MNKYRVRVCRSRGLKCDEILYENLSYSQALDKFRFIVDCALEFEDLGVEVVNIFLGKRCIKMFVNR